MPLAKFVVTHSAYSLHNCMIHVDEEHCSDIQKMAEDLMPHSLRKVLGKETKPKARITLS